MRCNNSEHPRVTRRTKFFARLARFNFRLIHCEAMSVGVGADKAKFRRLTSEGAAVPCLSILQRVADAAARLLAGVICALSGPSRSKIDIDIAWLTTIATQFRSAAARHVRRRRTGNIGASDIARRHRKVDNSIHFGETHAVLSVKLRAAAQAAHNGQNPVRTPHFIPINRRPVARDGSPIGPSSRG
jgi:hypothetical protein